MGQGRAPASDPALLASGLSLELMPKLVCIASCDAKASDADVSLSAWDGGETATAERFSEDEMPGVGATPFSALAMICGSNTFDAPGESRGWTTMPGGLSQSRRTVTSRPGRSHPQSGAPASVAYATWCTNNHMGYHYVFYTTGLTHFNT